MTKKKTTKKKGAKKKPTTKAVVKRNGGAVTSSTPDFMAGHMGKGTEDINMEDLEIPRMKLLSAKSPEVEEGTEKSGTYFHSILEECWGDKVLIVPVFIRKRYLLWKPRWDGGGILARADDGVHWTPSNGEWEVAPIKDAPKLRATWRTAPTVRASGLDQWGSSYPEDPDSQPAGTLMYDLVCVCPERLDVGPFVITLQRSAIKVAKKLLSKLKLSTAPIYGLVYEMTSVKEQGGENVYDAYRFMAAGFVSEELFAETAKLHEQLSESGVRIKDEESLQDEDDLNPADTSPGSRKEGKGPEGPKF